MTTTQQFWAPVPTTIIISAPIDDAGAAENISTFLQIHHGELPGDSNATASLVRLMQGLRSSTKSSTTAVEAVELPKSPEKKKKRKHDSVDANATTIADNAAEPAIDEPAIEAGDEPIKKKKKKEKKDKKDKKRKEAETSHE